MGFFPWMRAKRIVVPVVLLAAALPLLVPSSLRAAPPAQPSDNASTIDLTNLQSQFESVAARVAPSVVAISAAVETATDADDALRTDSLNTDKLERMLERITRTVGTGFVIDSDGYILTNEHVIGESSQIWVTTDNRKVYPAIVVGSDPRADLAVLKIPARNLPPVKLATIDTVKRGMWSIALGNPYGLAAEGEMSMSVGVISALDRSLPKLANQENRYYANLVQTTAEINPGNSGGPLFNINGEVIGVSTAVILPQKQTNGIGFALPITTNLLKEVEQLKQGNEVVYAYLGVMVSNATPRQRRAASINDDLGVVIDSIEKDSPAGDTLKPGDVVTGLNNVEVSDSDQFVQLIGRASVDEPARVQLRREGKPLTLSIKLRRRELPSVAINRANQRLRWQGMLIGPIPANWDFGPVARRPAGLMVIGVDPTSALSRSGVRSGAIITKVGGKAVSGVIDLQTILNDTPAEQCAVEFASQPKEAMVSGQ
jgi:S1-C subfamily serine protease